MTLTEFINTYNGTKVGSGQCVALINKYEEEVLGLTVEAVGNAHQYYDDYETTPFLYNNFNRFAVSSGVPQVGDIIVWSTAVGGGYGHIAIVTGDISSSSFTSFDQNWNTPLLCNIETHDYTNVLGWLRLKTGPTPVYSIKRKKFPWAIYANKLRNKNHKIF